MEVVIKHDPNTKVTYMTINGFNVSMVSESYGYGKINRMLEKKTPIADWAGANGDWTGILNEIVSACNVRQILFLFTGSRKDFEILKNSCEKQNIERAIYCDISYEFEYEIADQSEIHKKVDNTQETQIIVTANMSSGKSTLINALVGKKVKKTSMEVCTAKVSYIHNALCDNIESEVTSCSEANSESEINGHISPKDEPTDIYVRFNSQFADDKPICLIDTPGVDASESLDFRHKQITYQELLKNDFDKIVYVISSDNTGTDSEIDHLRWVSKNIGDKDIIFVLNKVDMYSPEDDDIDDCVEKLRTELVGLGFDDPAICPVSAQFGYLLKRKMSGCELSKDEERNYLQKSISFNDSFYDMTRFYTDDDSSDIESYEMMYKQSGMYYLEKTLFSALEDNKMKAVFIKYNPYKLETEFTVDGEKLAENSRIGEKIVPGSRLQDWIEELPELLVEEYNDKSIRIVFHGTALDYEDIKEVFANAEDNGKISDYTLEHIPAKETSDKIPLIGSVFKEIQSGPFDELRDPEVIDAFNKANGGEFEVCVVATMSAGKSTLINAMLGAKLMPSKQEACTAVITRIKDVDDSKTWKADVYNKDAQRIKTFTDLNYADMTALNADKDVSEIRISGNIPFVRSDDTSLVLIDTPGPNNARNPEHRKVQSEFLSKSSKSLVLYIMTGTFGNNDDNELLKRVAESMAVEGKQSKDRFIFVVNKMDDRNVEDDGEIDDTLERVRDYLKGHGIANPNVFPAAALPALNIRRLLKGEKLIRAIARDAEKSIETLNDSEFHLEEHTPLPGNLKKEIENELEVAERSDDEKTQALIHSGIPSIEASIRQYVEKYAKTAKITNIVNTFMHKLESLGCMENLKKELATDCEKREKIIKAIGEIRCKIDNANEAKKFEAEVQKAQVNMLNEAEKAIKAILKKYQDKIIEFIDQYRCKLNKSNNDDVQPLKIDFDQAEEFVETIRKLVETLSPDFEVDLNDVIEDTIVKVGNDLIEAYKKKIDSLAEEIGFNGEKIKIDPLSILNGSIPNFNDSLKDQLKHKEKVKDGEEWVENTDKKWYKPWTWFQEKGYFRTKYRDEEFIYFSELSEELQIPIQDNIYENGEQAVKLAISKSEEIIELFNNEFEKIDGILKNKLDELENYANNEEAIADKIKDTEEKIKWIDNLKKKVNSILEL